MITDKTKEITRDFVATVYCVDKHRVLLIFHKKLNMWLPPGGHVDKDELPCKAAVREFKEETGLDVELIGKEENIGHVKKLIQPNHIQLENIKKDHQHIDLVYFGRLKDPNQIKTIQKDEVDDARWFSEKDLGSPEITYEVRHFSKIALMEVR